MRTRPAAIPTAVMIHSEAYIDKSEELTPDLAQTKPTMEQTLFMLGLFCMLFTTILTQCTCSSATSLTVTSALIGSPTLSTSTASSDTQVNPTLSTASTGRWNTTTIAQATSTYSTVTGPAAVCTLSAEGQEVSTPQPLADLATASDMPAWPGRDSWLTFDSLKRLNPLGQTCAWGTQSVTPNTVEETQAIYDAIDDISQKTCVDRRFILATVLQESSGCVRVPTTQGAIANPGLMQSHNGTGTCYDANPISSCPYASIYQMIYDGVTGGSSDTDQDNLVVALNNVQRSTTASDAAAIHYDAAAYYNGGPHSNFTQIGMYKWYIMQRLVGAVW